MDEMKLAKINRSALIKDIDDDENDLSYVPEEDREVFIERAQVSIFELHRRHQRGDIILQPTYQRKDVWTKPKKSKLIESVLRNIPIPSIYFAETRKNEWEVIDGQQRLRALFDFLDGDYSLSQLPVLTYLRNKSFKDLEPTFRRKIEDYQLHIFIIKKESHPDIRFDIFERINEGAAQLNAQELRNSIYRGKRIEFIKKLTENPNFKKVIYGKLQRKRLKDQEAVLRFLSFYLKGYDEYNGNLNSFLNETLEFFDSYVKDPDHLERKFSLTMDNIYQVFGRKAFIKSDVKIQKINMSLFDILSYSFAIQNDPSLLINNSELIIYSLSNLIEKDEEFKRSITSNTNTKKNVIYRFETWNSTLNAILDGGRSK